MLCKLRVSILAFLFALLSGCVQNQVQIFYNHSGEDLEITCEHEKGIFRTYKIKHDHSLEIPLCFSISIASKTNTWKYLPLKVPDEYYENRASGKILKEQIEKDGGIYLLPPGENFPSLLPGRQPKGYPLKPQE